MVGFIGVPEIIAAGVGCLSRIAVIVEIRDGMDDPIARIGMAGDMLLELAEMRGEGVLLLLRQILVADYQHVMVAQRPQDQRLQWRRQWPGEIGAGDLGPAGRRQPRPEPRGSLNGAL